MEQAAALTMSDKTAPPTREATPAPAPAAASTDSQPAAGTSADATAGNATAESSTAAPAPQRQSGLYSGSLEEEVGQVIKGFNSFWGAFKTKSAPILTSIKTDLEKTGQQIKTDLEKTGQQLQEDFKQLQTQKVEVVRKEPEQWEAELAAEEAKIEEERAKRLAEKATKEKGKGRAVDGEETAPVADTATAQATALFNRLTSQTTQLSESLQATFNTTLAAAKDKGLTDPAKVREQLAENLRLSSARENLTLSFNQAEKLAEEYLKKGEGLIKEGQTKAGSWVKDAEKWVEDNVKVVAPEGEQTFVSSGWDAGEWYTFSTAPSTAPAAPASAEGARTPRASVNFAGSRKDALLARLRADHELLTVDPAGSEESDVRQAEFAKWIKETWPTAQKEGREAEEEHVGAIRMALVPEHLTDEQFWQRYLFHKDMIEAADARRKLLMQATQEDTADDEFNWDDDEEEEKSVSPSVADATTPTQAASGAVSTTPAASVIKEKPPVAAPPAAAPALVPAAAPAAAPATAAVAPSPEKASAATSPRDSEESYDVVSGRTSTAAATEDDDDSDWE